MAIFQQVIKRRNLFRYWVYWYSNLYYEKVCDRLLVLGKHI